MMVGFLTCHCKLYCFSFLQRFWSVPGAMTLCVHVAVVLRNLRARAIRHWPGNCYQWAQSLWSWLWNPGSGSHLPCSGAMMSRVTPAPPGDGAPRIKLGSPHTKVNGGLGNTPQIIFCPRLARPIGRHRLWARRFARYWTGCPEQEYLSQFIIMVLEPYFKTLTITSHLWGSKIFS